MSTAGNNDDSSMEFDLFEDARRKLAEFLTGQGRDPLEAERIASYVIQGVRGVPKLITALNEHKPQDTEQVQNALGAVLDNAAALGKAKNLLLGIDDEIAH